MGKAILAFLAVMFAAMVALLAVLFLCTCLGPLFGGISGWAVDFFGWGDEFRLILGGLIPVQVTVGQFGAFLGWVTSFLTAPGIFSFVYKAVKD